MKINNPLGFRYEHISSVLEQLASQENCDGEPYDQMVLAAKYIQKLERRIEDLEAGLNNLIEVAEKCDSWEAFPSSDLETAQKILDN